MKKSLLLCIFTCISILHAFSQTQNNPDFIDKKLDKYIKTAMKEWNVPGLAIAIVKDGKVVRAQGYGTQAMNSKKEVDENTLFMIASNTKAFVGTALAYLEHEEKCSLNDKVVKWVPDFRMHNPQLTAEVNLTDILTHRLGFKTFQGDFMYFYSNISKEQVYEKFPLVIPEYDFRTRYGYCNAGYFWAGECIQAISEVSWDNYLYNNILSPIEMSRTRVLSSGFSNDKNSASAHTLQDGKLTIFPATNIDAIGPAASMCSSAKDMSHWLMVQTDSGRYNGKQVIPWEVIQNTRMPRSISGRAGHPFNATHYSLYGLGWGMKDYEGREVISHTGGILGFVSAVAIIPEEKLGICILTNTDENWLYEALQWEIIDAYLGLPERNYSKLYKRFYDRRQNNKQQEINILRDSVSMAGTHPLGLDAFTGNYTSEVYGTLEITKNEDNSLQMHFEHHPDLKARLEYLSGNRFLCTYFPGRMGVHVFPFTIENQQVKSFELHVADRLEYTGYTFTKNTK